MLVYQRVYTSYYWSHSPRRMSSSERSSPAAAEIDPSRPAARRCSGNPGRPNRSDPWGLEDKLQEIPWIYMDILLKHGGVL